MKPQQKKKWKNSNNKMEKIKENLNKINNVKDKFLFVRIKIVIKIVYLYLTQKLEDQEIFMLIRFNRLDMHLAIMEGNKIF